MTRRKRHLFLVEVLATSQEVAIKHVGGLAPLILSQDRAESSEVKEITLVDHIDQIPVRRGVSTEVPPQYKHPE